MLIPRCFNLLLAATIWSSFVGAPAAAEEPKPPNILILLGDDIDRDTLGPWDGEALTPNLDRLAADGVRLDLVYANVAMCAPFRQELYSGRVAWRTRAIPNHSRSTPDTKGLPHYLRPLGYEVGLLGKNHVGPKEAYPFDIVGNLPMKEDANPKAVKLARGYITKARDAGKPFCLVVASHDGHGPYTHGAVESYDPDSLTLPQDSVDTPVYRESLAKHLAEVTNLDALLGDLRGVLAEEGLADNTLVLFCSEQGNAFPFSKWTCFDDGLASGVVAALPGVIPAGGNSTQLTWIADITPTLVEAAGGEIAEDDFDGKSQWSNFKGGDEKVHEYAFGAFSNCNIIDNRDRVFPIRSIRDERYTLLWSPRANEDVTSNTSLTQALEFVQAGEKTKGNPNPAASWVLAAWKSKDENESAIIKRLHHRPKWALFDRHADPDELTNLAENPEMAPVLERLQGELKSWLERWDDGDPVATERSFIKKKK
ncbi:MAG: sulfatase [Verrucomicrobiota bacterium]